MKGLFIKDFKLMLLQKNFLLIILVIVIGMMAFTDDVVFPLGFLSFVASLFTVSTISYDDFDNGNAFLFTFGNCLVVFNKTVVTLQQEIKVILTSIAFQW